MDVEVHMEMTTKCGKDNGLSDAQVNALMLGAQDADKQGWNQDWHFDGRKNFAEIQIGWNKINARIRLRGDYYGLGYDIHNTQDFYAHSNYVELHVEFYKDTVKVMTNYTLDSCPVYEEGIKIKDFLEKYLIAKKLHSGMFSLLSNEFTPWTSKSSLGPETHYRMNKDNSVTALKGSEYVEGTMIRYAELAKAVAMKATNIILSIPRTGMILRMPPEYDSEGFQTNSGMWP